MSSAADTTDKTLSKIGKRLQGIEISSEYVDDVLDHGETAKHENRFVFETAWEVANKGLAQW